MELFCFRIVNMPNYTFPQVDQIIIDDLPLPGEIETECEDSDFEEECDEAVVSPLARFIAR